MGFSGTPKDMGPPKMVSGTHTIPISLGILMGVVWEEYGKLTIRGSHYWGSRESPLIPGLGYVVNWPMVDKSRK